MRCVRESPSESRALESRTLDSAPSRKLFFRLAHPPRQPEERP
jgi:hypothetical protein